MFIELQLIESILSLIKLASSFLEIEFHSVGIELGGCMESPFAAISFSVIRTGAGWQVERGDIHQCHLLLSIYCLFTALENFSFS